MDLGPITIVCKESPEVDPVLLGSLHDHFRPYEEAGVTMTADEFIIELARGYGGYIEKLTKDGIITENMKMEDGLKLMTPLNNIAVSLLLDGNKAKATLLLRQLKNLANGKITEIENIYAQNFFARMDKDLQGLAAAWRIVAEKTEV